MKSLDWWKSSFKNNSVGLTTSTNVVHPSWTEICTISWAFSQSGKLGICNDMYFTCWNIGFNRFGDWHHDRRIHIGTCEQLKVYEHPALFCVSKGFSRQDTHFLGLPNALHSHSDQCFLSLYFTAYTLFFSGQQIHTALTQKQATIPRYFN